MVTNSAAQLEVLQSATAKRRAAPTMRARAPEKLKMSAASLQAVADGLRAADGIEAATRSLGTAAGLRRAAATTEALATVA